MGSAEQRIATPVDFNREMLMNGSHYNSKALTRRWRLDPSDVLRPEEFRRMVALAQNKAQVGRTRRLKPRDLAVLVLAGQQGLRVGEIAGLRMEHLERLAEGILYVRTLKLRSRAEQSSVDESLIDDGVRAALERYIRTVPAEIRSQEEHPLFFNQRTGSALTTYASGGTRTPTPTSPAANVHGNGEEWSNVWTTNDPGAAMDFSASPRNHGRHLTQPGE